jgi:ketosteroid isomerase-like protein
MKKKLAMSRRGATLRKTLVFLLVAMFWGANITLAAGQKDKKKKKDDASLADSSKMPSAMTDEQQIDYMLSVMLGALQVGDVEKLHSTYADDVSMVNGSWAPPIMGWPNYLAVYQQQRARIQRVRLDRMNTYIKVNGNTGWACYQWDFSATLDGQPMESQGQTTVVVEKRNNQWVIVHNHTSLTPGLQHAPANTTTPQQPSEKPKGL